MARRDSISWGLILLAVWLLAQGVLYFVNIQIRWEGAIMALLAIVAGILILLDR